MCEWVNGWMRRCYNIIIVLQCYSGDSRHHTCNIVNSIGAAEQVNKSAISSAVALG